MSECVVRMEIPSSCFGCPMSFSYNKIIICSLDNDRRKGDFDFRPDWCPILCQLPEGHGRLVDAEILRAKLIEHIAETNGFYNAFNETPTIVPAERI